MSPKDFVQCEKYGCLLSKRACVKRQKMAVSEYKRNSRGLSKTVTGEIRFSHCRNCKQGREIMEQEGKTVNKNVAMLADKLIRSADPELYKCSKCGQMLPKENFPTRKDRKRGVESMCKACRLNYQRERRLKLAAEKAAKAKQATPKRKKAAPDVVPNYKAGSRMEHIDFSDYPDLHSRIQAIAKDEMRSVPMQILFFIRHNLPEMRVG